MAFRFPMAVTLAAASFFLAPHSFPAQSPAPASSIPIVPPAYGEKIQIAGVHNAGKVSSVLFRGNQPRPPAFSELKKLGVTAIVDLRGEDRNTLEWERKQAEAQGLRFISIPVGGWSSPTNEQVAQFLSLFREDPKQIIFVHCRFGDDRTGVFVATYRMAVGHWSAEQALKEMYFFGFNGFWHPGMKSFVRDFPARLSTVPAFARFAAAPPSAPAASN